MNRLQRLHDSMTDVVDAINHCYSFQVRNHDDFDLFSLHSTTSAAENYFVTDYAVCCHLIFLQCGLLFYNLPTADGVQWTVVANNPRTRNLVCLPFDLDYVYNYCSEWNHSRGNKLEYTFSICFQITVNICILGVSNGCFDT